MPAYNKPLAIMAADVKTHASALRKNVSDYPQYSKLDSATIASAKTLSASKRSAVHEIRIRKKINNLKKISGIDKANIF